MCYELYFIRHGETDWNKQNRFQGHTDIPLNQNGRNQAMLLSSEVRNLGIQAVVCSDLARAKETAEIAFSGLDLPMFTTPSLREIKLGVVEGLTKTEVVSKFGESRYLTYSSIHPSDLDFSFPEGETKLNVVARAKFFLEEFLAKNSYKTIAVSTHGGVLYWFCHSCDGSPSKPIPITHCTVYKVILDHNNWRYIGPILQVTER